MLNWTRESNQETSLIHFPSTFWIPVLSISLHRCLLGLLFLMRHEQMSIRLQIEHRWQTKEMVPLWSTSVNQWVYWDCLQEHGWLTGSCITKNLPSMGDDSERLHLRALCTWITGGRPALPPIVATYVTPKGAFWILWILGAFCAW